MRISAALLTLAASAALLPACSLPERAGGQEAMAEAPPRSFPDAVALDNGLVRLEVSPAAGRVTHFGPVGGRNLLWIAAAPAAGDEQAYDNVGGDKLWPTSQMLWGAATGNDLWPPDGVIDGSPWQLVVADGQRIVIRSAESDDYGLVVTREFRLIDNAAQARISNTLLRTRPNPFPVSAWTVTQVRMPERAVLDAAADRPAGTPTSIPLTPSTTEKIGGRTSPIGLRGTGAVAWQQGGERDAKLGSYGRWVAAVYPDLTFLQRTAYDPAGGYLDASSVQVYRGDPYLELELWSPLGQPAPGEEVRNEVVWEILDVREAEADRFLIDLDEAGER